MSRLDAIIATANAMRDRFAERYYDRTGVRLDFEWRSWVHHAPDTAAQFLTAGDWPRCSKSDFYAATRARKEWDELRCETCVPKWWRDEYRPLLGFPPYERAPFAPSPICAALMRRSQ